MLKVLVTGGCGFLGSHVCEFYIKHGNSVVAFDNLTKHELKRSGYNVEAAREHVLNFLKILGVKVVKGDIRNKDELLRASKDCDYIVHTAAQPAMTISIENPELDLTTNVIGTFNILEAARKYDIPVVICSTIHVYGNKINETLKEGETRFLREPPIIDENHPVMEGTITPLHASKRAAELYVQTFIDTYGLKAAVFRLTGLYGPRQFGGEDHGWVANFTIRTILEKPITLFGTGKQVRDILYATDAVRAFDAFYKTQASGIYNIGGGMERAISLMECINIIEKIVGKKAEIKYAPKRKGDLWYFVCDITKAKEKLGWQPEVTNETGIKKLAEWVEDNIEIFRGRVS
jgi:CDP-paratose 2-epimerase